MMIINNKIVGGVYPFFGFDRKKQRKIRCLTRVIFQFFVRQNFEDVKNFLSLIDDLFIDNMIGMGIEYFAMVGEARQGFDITDRGILQDTFDVPEHLRHLPFRQRANDLNGGFGVQDPHFFPSYASRRMLLSLLLMIQPMAGRSEKFLHSFDGDHPLLSEFDYVRSLPQPTAGDRLSQRTLVEMPELSGIGAGEQRVK